MHNSGQKHVNVPEYVYYNDSAEHKWDMLRLIWNAPVNEVTIISTLIILTLIQSVFAPSFYSTCL